MLEEFRHERREIEELEEYESPNAENFSKVCEMCGNAICEKDCYVEYPQYNMIFCLNCHMESYGGF